MITRKTYKRAKKIIEKYESQQLNISGNIHSGCCCFDSKMIRHEMKDGKICNDCEFRK